jgi:hypothetical protein
VAMNVREKTRPRGGPLPASYGPPHFLPFFVYSANFAPVPGRGDRKGMDTGSLIRRWLQVLLVLPAR